MIQFDFLSGNTYVVDLSFDGSMSGQDAIQMIAADSTGAGFAFSYDVISYSGCAASPADFLGVTSNPAASDSSGKPSAQVGTVVTNQALDLEKLDPTTGEYVTVCPGAYEAVVVARLVNAEGTELNQLQCAVARGVELDHELLHLALRDGLVHQPLQSDAQLLLADLPVVVQIEFLEEFHQLLGLKGPLLRLE